MRVTAAQRRVTACIVEAAREGKRARAVVVGESSPQSGEVIATYVFVRGLRNVLVVTDTTRWTSGPAVWSRFRCDGLELYRGVHLRWRDCVDLGRGKPTWLKPIKLPR